MGLLGFIGKAVGKVAKVGLSVATKGMSDKVLSVLKSRGERAHKDRTLKAAKVAAQLSPTPPRVTEVRSRARVLLDRAQVQNRFGVTAQREAPATNARPGRPIPRARPATPGARAPRAAKPRRRPAAARSSAPAKVRASGKRKAPSGGLDLKALSSSWRAAGKPGTWIDWVKANK